MATLSLPTHPELRHLRRQARALQRDAVAGDPVAAARDRAASPEPSRRPGGVPAQRRAAHPGQGVRLCELAAVASLPRRAGRAQLDPDRRIRTGPVRRRAVLPARLPHVLGHGRTRPQSHGTGAPRRDPGTDRGRHLGRRRCGPVGRRRSAARTGPHAGPPPGGPHGWRPLGYLAYSRVGGGDAVGTARLLLDAGADANEGYLWHGEPTLFTLLTGVFGEGEGGPVNQPRHPQSLALARLLLDHGANPNDGQTLYNRMFGTDDDHLVLLFEYGLGRGDGGVWRRRLGSEAVDEPRKLVRDLLRWAVEHGQVARVRLLADQGVDLHAPFDDGAWPTAGPAPEPGPSCPALTREARGAGPPR